MLADTICWADKQYDCIQVKLDQTFSVFSQKIDQYVKCACDLISGGIFILSHINLFLRGKKDIYLCFTGNYVSFLGESFLLYFSANLFFNVTGYIWKTN